MKDIRVTSDSAEFDRMALEAKIAYISRLQKDLGRLNAEVRRAKEEVEKTWGYKVPSDEKPYEGCGVKISRNSRYAVKKRVETVVGYKVHYTVTIQ